MNEWTLIYYETAAGGCPVAEYLDSLQAQQAERVVRKLDLLEAMGTALKSPHVAHITDKVWELRVMGRVQHRVFYVTFQEREIILLHAFTMKTQKTPRHEIEIAETRLTDYKERQKR